MRSGTVAVIGRANAGKSTLINVMVGEKVAIVSPKPQTTRDRILGVLTRENYQIAFVDTPGIYKSRNVLTEDMMKTTETTSRDVDAILYVLDGHAGVREEDAELIKQAQRTAMLRDPSMAAATLTGAQAEAMKTAAGNKNGAMMGFMGMGMAQQAGGLNAQELYAMGQQQKAAPAAPAADGWKCSCGATATGNFCPSCGAKKPQPAANGWTCTCGQRNTGKFCSACGKPRPAEGWTCACGTVNQGKFCQNCGAKKPANEPQYRCDKCGWQPEDPRHPPKFCPECGDPFDFNDQI